MKKRYDSINPAIQGETKITPLGLTFSPKIIRNHRSKSTIPQGINSLLFGTSPENLQNISDSPDEVFERAKEEKISPNMQIFEIAEPKIETNLIQEAYGEDSDCSNKNSKHDNSENNLLNSIIKTEQNNEFLVQSKFSPYVYAKLTPRGKNNLLEISNFAPQINISENAETVFL